MRFKLMALSAMSALLPFAGHSTPSCIQDAMVVFDGSGSMAELDFNIPDVPRIVEARQAVRRAMPQIASIRRLGLIIYGPGQDDACSNIDLRFGPTGNAAPQIISEVDTLQPDGMTPLSASVRQAAEVLNHRAAPGTIVLVTDGKETCGGTPCALGAELAATSLGLTVHVIGFKVRNDFFAWNNPEKESYDDGLTVAKCLADHTGGKYVSTETVDELVMALKETLGCALIGRLNDPQTAQQG